MADDNSAGEKTAAKSGTVQPGTQDSDKRDALREQFSDGKIPTGEHFGNLIDAFVLNEALEGDHGVLDRLDELEKPANGSFTESVSIGASGGRWDINAGANGSLQFRPQTGNPAGWVQMPARIGALSRDTDADKLPQIDALNLQPSQLNGRDFYLASPRSGPFAVEVVATVEPEVQEVGPGESRPNFVMRLINGILRPPARPAMIRAVAVSAGGETVPQVDYHATPATTRRVALTRAVTEFIVIAAAVFFYSDKINTELQQVTPQNDWFEKSFVLSVQQAVACPVLTLAETTKPELFIRAVGRRDVMRIGSAV